MRIASIVVVIALAILTISAPASADPGSPGGTTGGATGGAASRPLTPAEKAASAKKKAELHRWLASLKKPPTVRNTRGASILTLPPGCTDCAVAAGSLYQEPQAYYAINWCGPGTTTALVSGWKYRNQGFDDIPSYQRYSNPDGAGPRWFSGETAFMQHLAYDLGVVVYSSNFQPISEPSTDVPHEESFESNVRDGANTSNGNAFYVVDQAVGTLSMFQSYLRFDIGSYLVPLSAIVNACPVGLPCLPGWSGAPSSMMHFVTAGAYSMPDDLITYGDSGGPSQGYGGNPYGWHDFTLSTFFDPYMLRYNGSGSVVW